MRGVDNTKYRVYRITNYRLPIQMRGVENTKYTCYRITNHGMPIQKRGVDNTKDTVYQPSGGGIPPLAESRSLFIKDLDTKKGAEGGKMGGFWAGGNRAENGYFSPLSISSIPIFR
jgi:hypothetical protein